ncbi:flagellar associated protein [Pycnococcus provasolii]
MASATPSNLVTSTFFLDAFAQRQWEPEYKGTVRITCEQSELVSRVDEAYTANSTLVDGYAPFCKHVFIKNFLPDVRVGALAITDENRHLLRSAYEKRRPEELAVLNRWFDVADVGIESVPVAEYLDIILYSREQLVKEYEAIPGKNEGAGANGLPDAPWGIISIKAQNESYETPMEPITAMRNALGREEGGSGVPIDRAAYDASVEYWNAHAPIRGL